MGAPVSVHERARLRIAHLRLAAADDLLPTLGHAALVSASTLSVARVGIWFFSEDRSELVQFVSFELGAAGAIFDPDRSLPLRDWPAYRAALESRRVVAAHDARSDPQTSELTASYLDAYGITSMLDAPIFIGGEVWGIVCHEHVGPPRQWTAVDSDFAISVADMVSSLLERSRRLETEIELRVRDAAAANDRRRDALLGMAAGVAHDFNTILQSVVLTARQATAEGDAERRSSLLAQVVAECERGSRFVRQLSDYASARSPSKMPIDVASVARAMEPTLQTLVGADHRLSLQVTEVPLFVQAERSQIERLLLNLVTNARNVTPPSGLVRVHLDEAPGAARLHVVDEGPGVEPADVGRIFEPFFTRSDGDGVGLGLSIVAAIVDDLGGRVDVGAADPRGARFEVVLPLAPET